MKRLTPVERAARAIHADDRAELSHLFPLFTTVYPWSRLAEIDRQWYRGRAKAAIAAGKRKRRV